MAHLSYEEQKKLVFTGLKILAIVTIVEVFIALLFNGHIFPGFHKHYAGFLGKHTGFILGGIYGLAMIGFSLYKARFIVYYFMHMAHEVRGLRWSVLLPTLLLVWAVIAFFQEGYAWRQSREKVHQRDMEEVERRPANGSLDYDKHTINCLI